MRGTSVGIGVGAYNGNEVAGLCQAVYSAAWMFIKVGVLICTILILGLRCFLLIFGQFSSILKGSHHLPMYK